MPQLCLVLSLGFLLVGSPGHAQVWTNGLFDQVQHDFGTVARGAKAEHHFVLHNRTVAELHLASVRSSCGCVSVRLADARRSLAPGESTAIVAALNSAAFLGARSATITVSFDQPAPAEAQLQVTAYIRSDVLIQPGHLEFGPLHSGVGAEKVIQVSSSGRYSWGLVEVKCPHPYLTCRVLEIRRDWSQVSYQVLVRLDPRAPPGHLRGHLILVTNEPHHREIPVLVEARVLPEVSVSPASLFLGVVCPGEEVNRQLVVRAKKPFRITGVKADGEGLEVDLGAEQLPQSMYLVPVTFRAGDEPGSVVQTIHIETDLEGGALAVPASVLVAPAQPGAESRQVASQAPAAAPPAPQALIPGQKPVEPLRPVRGRFPLLQRLFGTSSPVSQADGNARTDTAEAAPGADPSGQLR